MRFARFAAGAMLLSLVLTACMSLGGLGSGAPDGLAALRRDALAFVDAARAQQGLPGLRSDATLDRIAQDHAEDMLRRDYFAHVSPGGKDVRDRFVGVGGDRWVLVAENISTCRSCAPDRAGLDKVNRSWMKSPGHRANILRKGIERFGFGIAGADGRVYAVQTFAGPGASDASADAGAADASAIARTGLARVNEARKAAGVPPLTASDALNAGARAMLPRRGAATFEPGSMGDLAAGLPEGARGAYASYSTTIGICGGCGTVATTADAEDFVAQWLDTPRQRRTVLDPRFTRLGFAVGADGKGKKIGIAAFGETR